MEYLPYIATLLASALSGLVSYIVSMKTCSAKMEELKESNRHEIERLMTQHQLDLEGMEKMHEQEIERLALTHQQKIEELEKEAQNQMANNMMTDLLKMAISTPEAQKLISDSFKRAANSSRK